MKATRITAVVALLVVGGLALHLAPAQQQSIKRAELQRHDLGVPGRGVVQVRVDFGPGAAFGRYRHPGEEIAYVIEGSLEYEVEGRPTVTLRPTSIPRSYSTSSWRSARRSRASARPWPSSRR